MNWVIVIAGVVGLGVAGYGLVALVVHAWRRGRYLEIGVALGVAVATVLLLTAFGDRLIR